MLTAIYGFTFTRENIRSLKRIECQDREILVPIGCRHISGLHSGTDCVGEKLELSFGYFWMHTYCTVALDSFGSVSTTPRTQFIIYFVFIIMIIQGHKCKM